MPLQTNIELQAPGRANPTTSRSIAPGWKADQDNDATLRIQGLVSDTWSGDFPKDARLDDPQPICKGFGRHSQ